MEGPANTAAPEADPSLLLNTMALNVKVCRELLQQTRVSLDCVEARLGPGHGARSVSRPASHTAAGQALGPSSARYSLFRGLPEDSEWAQLLERQLCTRTFELLPTEQLAEALSFLTETEESHHYQSAEGPQHQSAEGPQHQSAKGPQHQSEGPTLYQSALELSRSDSTQELQPRGGAHMEEDLSDNGESDGNSEEGPLSPPTPSLGLLHMELELSSISHSPHQHKMLNVLFKRHLAPCNSTPRNTGVQPIFESRPLVNSLSASQSFCTAVDEPADHSEGDVYADTKKTQEVLLFESDVTAEGEAQETAEGASEADGTSEESEGTAEGEVYLGLALDHQLCPGHIGVRTHLTPDNVQDSAQEKDSALVCEVSREKLGSEESSLKTKDCCSPHAHGEPQWSSLLSRSARAHSTLDDILHAHVQD